MENAQLAQTIKKKRISQKQRKKQKERAEKQRVEEIELQMKQIAEKKDLIAFEKKHSWSGDPTGELYYTFLKQRDCLDTYKNCINMIKQFEKIRESSGDCCVRTKYTNTHELKNLTENMLLRDPVLIKIEPHLENNMCFQNSLYLEKTQKWKRVAGYNATACPCGKMFCFEIHSVNIDDTGKYRDFTIDFNCEKKKWFLPLVKQDKPAQLIAGGFNHQFDTLCINRDKCTCGVEWREDMGANVDTKKAEQMIEAMQRIKVWGFHEE